MHKINIIDYLDIERTERQAVGRSGRKGAVGETKVIVSEEELLKPCYPELASFCLFSDIPELPDIPVS